jgi:hypothetical protein
VQVTNEKKGRTIGFKFDHIFRPNKTQENVYERIGTELLNNLKTGFSTTLIAYGQTASGKTYTMNGPEAADPTLKGKPKSERDRLRGVVPRLISDVFAFLESAREGNEKFTVAASYMEVYKGKLIDLLVPAVKTKPKAGASDAEKAAWARREVRSE